MHHTYLTIDGHYWLPSADGDERAFALMSRHYTFQAYEEGRPAQRPQQPQPQAVCRAGGEDGTADAPQ